MSTFDEFYALRDYIKSNVGCNVKIGLQDIGTMDYPCILLIPDEPSTIDTPKNVNLVTYQYGMKIQIIDSREPESLIRTMKMFDDFIESINNFKPENGHVLDEDFTPEYDDNRFTITFRYLMKFQRQKTS